MPTLTAILGLSKPAGTETLGAAVTEYNGNFDIIDAAMGNKVDKGAAVTNLIATTAVAGSVPLVAKGILLQSANLFEARNNVDVVKASIDPNGVFYSNGVAVGGAGSPLSLIANTAAERPLLIKGAASQSANLTEWQDSSGTISAFYRGGGILHIGTTLIGGTAFVVNLDYQGPTTKGIVVRGAASQSANPLEIQDSTGALLALIDSGGILRSSYLASGPARITNSMFSVQSDGLAIARIIAIIRGMSGQTGNLLEAQNNSGTLMSGVAADGALIVNNLNSVTTARGGGAAAALPANPLSYLKFITHDGNVRYVPCYS